MKEVFDAVIVGGGLAGLSLAIQLAEANRSVLVIEKKRYPFHRVCGEYVSMESWNFLERIGLPLREMQLPVINMLQVSSVGGNMVTHPLAPGGFGISRFLLDSSLAAIAKSKGVQIFEDTRAEEIALQGDLMAVQAGRNQYIAKVVIGAYGKRSNIDKQLQRSFISVPKKADANWVGVKYHIRSDLLPNIIQLHNFKGGYCGISKVEGDHYCLCYLTKAENLKAFDGSIRRMEEELLSLNPLLKKIFFNRNHFLFEQPETISQVSFESKKAVEKNVLMLGDAAGLIAPLCGNGMSMAFHSAAICFGVIEKFFTTSVSREEMEQLYIKLWKKQFSARLSAGRLLQPLLVNTTLSSPAIGLLKRLPFVMKQVIKATHGKSF
ncbi:MAG: NAD(P)/FAD-dependent oxidoreductase [Chitinophagaceae bacterium]|nr:NAD(P)/FAD-dependent oxidoreductase [Chitinophagaceae bacterium]